MRIEHAQGIASAVFGVCLNLGAAWCFAHAYEGQPAGEGLAPLAVAIVVGGLLALLAYVRLLRYVD